VLIGSVQPLPYSPNRYTINITVLTLESPSSSLLAWLKDHAIILGVRCRLAVSSSSLAFALITINQRDRHILVPQATITNKCHSLYVALVSSIVVVIQIYSCTKLTWMDGWIFLRRRYTYCSLAAPSADHHIRVRIITTPPMRDHSSFVIEGAACYQHAGARYAHSLLVPFDQTDIRR